MQPWQTDPRRMTAALALRGGGPACALHPPALRGRSAQAFLDAGLPLAMGLEKSPRPAVHLGHPAAAWTVPGLRANGPTSVLIQAPGDAPGRASRAHQRPAPEGFEVLECEQVPNYATPAPNSAARARWRWPCPAGQLRPRGPGGGFPRR